MSFSENVGTVEETQNKLEKAIGHIRNVVK